MADLHLELAPEIPARGIVLHPELHTADAAQRFIYVLERCRRAASRTGDELARLIELAVDGLEDGAHPAHVLQA